MIDLNEIIDFKVIGSKSTVNKLKLDCLKQRGPIKLLYNDKILNLIFLRSDKSFAYFTNLKLTLGSFEIIQK